MKRGTFHLGLLRRRDVEAEVDEELAFHLAMRAERLQREGLSPSDAHESAAARFGSIDDIRAECLREDESVARFQRMTIMLRDFVQDARIGIRTLRKSPLFALAVIMTLGVGIGATAAVLSLVRAILLEPVTGVQNAASLFEARGLTSYPVVRELQRQLPGLSIAAISERPLAVRHGDAAELRPSAMVSGNFLAVSGVRIAIGRALLSTDDMPGASPVAVLSHAMWTTAFGADTLVVGRTIRVNDAPHTIVGVLAEDFRGIHLGSSPQVYIPLVSWPLIAPNAVRAEAMHTRNWEWLRVVGRIDAHTTLEHASSRLTAIAVATSPDREQDELAQTFALRDIQSAAMPAEIRGGAALFLSVLAVVVLLVLLTACANITGLLLSRATTRQRELAVRAALGAGRGRLVRHLLIESVLLAVAGGITAVAVHEGIRALIAASTFPGDISGASIPLRFDASLVAAIAALVIGCAMAIGLAPAFHGSRSVILDALRSGTSTTHKRHVTFRGVLVSAQVAVALVLLLGMGMFVRSLQAGLGTELGFDTDDITTMTVNTGAARMSLSAEQQYLRNVTDHLATQPGIERASWTTSLPLTNDTDRSSAVIVGYAPKPGERVSPEMNVVGPAYHSTLGIPLVAGREFDRSDVRGSMPTAIVNETLANRYLAGRDPLGAEIRMLGTTFRIVGVVRDAKYHTLQEEPVPYVYFNHLQMAEGSALTHVMVVVRSTPGTPASLLSLVRRVQSVNPSVPVFDARTLGSRVSEALAPQIAGSAVLGGFGVIALTVSLIGVYAMVAYGVSQRRREFGLRMALGAHPAAVTRLVLSSITRFVVFGLIIGTTVALLAAPALESMLVGSSGIDVATYVTIAMSLLLVCLLSSYLPARRVSGIQPLEALRHD